MGILTDQPDDDVADLFSDTPVQKWPHKIWLVRHGQSAGNVARAAAAASH